MNEVVDTDDVTRSKCGYMSQRGRKNVPNMFFTEDVLKSSGPVG